MLHYDDDQMKENDAVVVKRKGRGNRVNEGGEGKGKLEEMTKWETNGKW